ncbi:MAG: hypothetical protein O9262_04355, partial [Cyclobacteriaceae bacterium]|nr:hypothetical protein [Cyclobacteriaceae bacterium]
MGRGEGDNFDCSEFIRPEEDICLGLTQSTTVFNTFTLDSIKTNTGQKAIFFYQLLGRLDKGERSLNKINILVKEGPSFKLVKDFTLYQSYFISSESSIEDPTLKYRMRLDSVGEVSRPPYTFSYDPTPLPLRLSFSQDHWGYSNGKGNIHLLPREDHNGFETGADREPDFSFAKAGILTKLQYPTGGTLEFDYEPNTYYSEGGELYYTNEGTLLQHQAESTVTTSFTILTNSKRKKFFWNNSDDGLTTHNDFCVIEITGPNNYFRQLYGNGPVMGELVTLAPGTYTIRIETSGTTFGGNVSITWLNEWAKEPGNRVTGGFRIKSSKNCPGNGEDCIQNNYQYVREDATKSSGVIFQSPLYTHKRDRVFWKLEDGFCQPYQINCSPTLQSSNSITPLYSSQGTHIVYDHVVLFKITPEETGKTTFKFLVDKSQNPNYNAPPFPYVVTYDWLNGLPLETTNYLFKNQQFVPVKKTI